METIFGLIGALVGIGIFMFGFWFGRETYKPKKTETADPTEDELPDYDLIK